MIPISQNFRAVFVSAGTMILAALTFFPLRSGWRERAGCLGAIVAAALTFSAAADGGEIRLKNGTVLTGNIWLQSKLSDTPTGVGKFLTPKDVDPRPQNIILVDNGWQKYYVPRRQIPDDSIDKDVIPARPESFVFPVINKKNQSQVIASVGSIVDVSPFNEFGQRTISLVSAKGKLDVVQAISRIEPDHIILDATNYNWQVGLSLRALPPEILKEMLERKVKREDVVARFGLVRFYNQAELYKQAFEELESIVKDFPDQKARANQVRTQLIDYFGREVLRELNRRKAAGQHQTAYQYAFELTKPIQVFPSFVGQQLGGAVMGDVRKFLNDYDDAIKNIIRAKNLLVEWQAKVKEPEVIKQLQPLRSEINEQLNVETLPRLDAFLQAETDSKLTADQHLALAYSGWVVGAANAITNLDLAIRYWDARFTIIEAVRAESVQDRDQRYQELRRLEGVGPKAILQVSSLLPPFLDASGIRPGEAHRVLVTPEGHSPSIAYSVLLPPEYSPHHTYPLLIALRSHDRTSDDTLKWWGGGVDQPGPSMRRGYILIAPEYLEDRQSDYQYSLAAHQAVLESLKDARKRFNVDSNRVFLAGHGAGADAAFDIGMSHPDEFAGVIPVGGECVQYPRHTFMNGRHTAWYVIGRGFSSESRDLSSPVALRDPSNNAVFEDIFKNGYQFDFMLVEFLGRGLDRYLDEVPKVFEWMDLERRKPIPKEFDVQSLRKTDNRFFWATAVDLPWTIVLPQPAGAGNRVNPMQFKATITPGNTVRLVSPAKRYVLRFTPDSIDFDKRVEIKEGGGGQGRRLFYNFITPDVTAIVDELRSTGDRTRLPLATLEL